MFKLKSFNKSLKLINKYSTSTSFKNIIFETTGNVAVVKLNRPKALNALNKELCTDLKNVFEHIENNDDIKVTVITGEGGKSFAAGADIKEMSSKGFSDVYKDNLFGELDIIPKTKKPIIAAVNGFALGGGCELALQCDIILASKKAKFGQPEIKLGTIPGIGGTQRLTRAIGKSRAMEWILTGNMYTAEQACNYGLVSQIFEHDELLDGAIQMAKTIGSYSLPIIQMSKETVNKSFEMTLTEGLQFEKRVFQSTFATKDQKEGMDAFVNKRKPEFKNE